MAATSSSSSKTVEDATDLDRRFETDEPKEVQAYLERHPHLVPLLSDVATALARFFPSEEPLRLQVIDDADTRTEHLYAIVRTSLPPDEAEERLDRLDEEWWLNAAAMAKGDLTIDVESR